MTLIKSDIDKKSVTSYGTDYLFRNTKSYWSKAATLMLKAEVYLWTSQNGGGAADATIALNSLTDIQTNIPALALQTNFANVFAVTSRGNSEIIFAVRNLNAENSLPFAATFYPQTSLIANFHDSLNARQMNSPTLDNWGGLLRAPVWVATFRKFNNSDARKWFSIQSAYTRPSPGVYVIAGCFVKKFEGEQVAGVRVHSNDYPIYRYADLLLLIAEAKILLGQNPATEINLVRARHLEPIMLRAVLDFLIRLLMQTQSRLFCRNVCWNSFLKVKDGMTCAVSAIVMFSSTPVYYHPKLIKCFGQLTGRL